MRTLSAVISLCLLSMPVLAATPAELAAAGRAAMERHDLEKAAELLEQAIRAAPNVAEYHYLLGGTYGEQAMKTNIFGQMSLAKKAKAELERAVQLDPAYVDARLALIDYYLMAPGFMGGDPDKAVEQAAEVKKRNNVEGHRAYARVYARQKKVDLARKEYVDGVRENPASARAHYLLATFLLNEKNWTGSLQELEAAQKLDPGYMPVSLRLGQHAALSGQNYTRGEELLRKYLAYKPATGEPGHASAWYYLGMIQEKRGLKAEAKASYLKARQLAPTWKEVEEALERVS
jgi:tetratricopeptide (TPR) repeat protein